MTWARVLAGVICSLSVGPGPALLAQQHPDWSGERLKAALTGSATPGSYSSFQQGTGRTDLARALNQKAVTEHGPLSFGIQQWPHDDDKPVTKQLTYRNRGTEAVTLDLSVGASSVDGKPAAEGLFVVSPRRLTVPAGGEASADVTADTRAGTADGTFGGSVTATSADGTVQLRTAVGVEREVESYNLTLKHIDENGRPTDDAATQVTGYDREFFSLHAPELGGEVSVRLPKGEYSLYGMIHPSAASPTHAILVQPKLRLDADATVTVDARRARPVQITVPDPAAENTGATFLLTLGRAATRWQYVLPTFLGTSFGQLGPELPADEAFAQYSGAWTRQDDAGRPVAYHLSWERTGQLGGFTDGVERKRLAKVTVQAGAPVEGRGFQVAMSPHLRDGSFVNGYVLEGALPLNVTHYILDNGVTWSVRMWQMSGEEGNRHHESFLMRMPRTWKAGHSYTERFNVGVFGPSLNNTEGPTAGYPGAVRYGNVIRAYLPLFGDGSGHWGDSDYIAGHSSLRADGTEIPDQYGIPPTDGITEYTVPARDSAYELTLDTSRDPAASPVSTRVRAEWTFRSAETPTGEPTALPLSVIRFSPDLTLSSTAKAGKLFDVPFVIEGAAAGQQPSKLAFEVSYDEGATWRPAGTVGSTHLSLKHPAKAGSVSLRANLTDRDGNTLTETIERAYLTTP